MDEEKKISTRLLHKIGSFAWADVNGRCEFSSYANDVSAIGRLNCNHFTRNRRVRHLFFIENLQQIITNYKTIVSHILSIW